MSLGSLCSDFSSASLILQLHHTLGRLVTNFSSKAHCKDSPGDITLGFQEMVELRKWRHRELLGCPGILRSSASVDFSPHSPIQATAILMGTANR